jgi:hypothetical protein
MLLCYILQNKKKKNLKGTTGKCKVKLSLCLIKHHSIKTYGGVEVYLHAFLISALDGGEWSASHPGRYTNRERSPDTHWIGGWVGPRAGLDAVTKRNIPSPRRDSNLSLVGSREM